MAEKRMDLPELLRANPYPGRGIVLGLCPDGERAFAAYFIMGRSANSRNRVFAETKDGIETRPADPAKLEDASLIIYAPVRRVEEALVVTNGDQTDTIAEFLRRGLSFEAALRRRTFEPDAPNYTPRISGLVQPSSELFEEREGFEYLLSILKSEGGGRAVRRYFWEYPQPLAGTGHLLHTYAGSGEPLPSYEGEPTAVAIGGDIDTFGGQIWEALDSENKVALFVRTLGLDGTEETRIYNRYRQS